MKEGRSGTSREKAVEFLVIQTTFNFFNWFFKEKKTV